MLWLYQRINSFELNFNHRNIENIQQVMHNSTASTDVEIPANIAHKFGKEEIKRLFDGKEHEVHRQFTYNIYLAYWKAILIYTNRIFGAQRNH